MFDTVGIKQYKVFFPILESCLVPHEKIKALPFPDSNYIMPLYRLCHIDLTDNLYLFQLCIKNVIFPARYDGCLSSLTDAQ
jgi:hypothetical protein